MDVSGFCWIREALQPFGSENIRKRRELAAGKCTFADRLIKATRHSFTLPTPTSHSLPAL